jgi:hypothetical protein
LSVEFNERFTSHSFRKGPITKWWKRSGDVEFVRMIIGHSTIQTTSSYTTPLSDTEVLERQEHYLQKDPTFVSEKDIKLKNKTKVNDEINEKDVKD